jgi:hypothetical protein
MLIICGFRRLALASSKRLLDPPTAQIEVGQIAVWCFLFARRRGGDKLN